MLEASRHHPDLVCQLVPTSTSYRIDNVLRKLIAEGFVGDILSVEVQRLSRGFAGRRGDSELSPVPDPPEGQATYRVEEKFVNAIRGIEEITMVPFETGIHYMEWSGPKPCTAAPRRDRQ